MTTVSYSVNEDTINCLIDNKSVTNISQCFYIFVFIIKCNSK